MRGRPVSAPTPFAGKDLLKTIVNEYVKSSAENSDDAFSRFRSRLKVEFCPVYVRTNNGEFNEVVSRLGQVLDSSDDGRVLRDRLHSFFSEPDNFTEKKFGNAVNRSAILNTLKPAAMEEKSVPVFEEKYEPVSRKEATDFLRFKESGRLDIEIAKVISQILREQTDFDEKTDTRILNPEHSGISELLEVKPENTYRNIHEKKDVSSLRHMRNIWISELKSRVDKIEENSRRNREILNIIEGSERPIRERISEKYKSSFDNEVNFLAALHLMAGSDFSDAHSYKISLGKFKKTLKEDFNYSDDRVNELFKALDTYGASRFPYDSIGREIAAHFLSVDNLRGEINSWVVAPGGESINLLTESETFTVTVPHSIPPILKEFNRSKKDAERINWENIISAHRSRRSFGNPNTAMIRGLINTCSGSPGFDLGKVISWMVTAETLNLVPPMKNSEFIEKIKEVMTSEDVHHLIENLERTRINLGIEEKDGDLLSQYTSSLCVELIVRSINDVVVNDENLDAAIASLQEICGVNVIDEGAAERMQEKRNNLREVGVDAVDIDHLDRDEKKVGRINDAAELKLGQLITRKREIEREVVEEKASGSAKVKTIGAMNQMGPVQADLDALDVLMKKAENNPGAVRDGLTDFLGRYRDVTDEDVASIKRNGDANELILYATRKHAELSALKAKNDQRELDEEKASGSAKVKTIGAMNQMGPVQADLDALDVLMKKAENNPGAVRDGLTDFLGRYRDVTDEDVASIKRNGDANELILYATRKHAELSALKAKNDQRELDEEKASGSAKVKIIGAMDQMGPVQPDLDALDVLMKKAENDPGAVRDGLMDFLGRYGGVTDEDVASIKRNGDANELILYATRKYAELSALKAENDRRAQHPNIDDSKNSYSANLAKTLYLSPDDGKFLNKLNPILLDEKFDDVLKSKINGILADNDPEECFYPIKQILAEYLIKNHEDCKNFNEFSATPPAQRAAMASLNATYEKGSSEYKEILDIYRVNFYLLYEDPKGDAKAVQNVNKSIETLRDAADRLLRLAHQQGDHAGNEAYIRDALQLYLRIKKLTSVITENSLKKDPGYIKWFSESAPEKFATREGFSAWVSAVNSGGEPPRLSVVSKDIVDPYSRILQFNDGWLGYPPSSELPKRSDPAALDRMKTEKTFYSQQIRSGYPHRVEAYSFSSTPADVVERINAASGAPSDTIKSMLKRVHSADELLSSTLAAGLKGPYHIGDMTGRDLDVAMAMYVMIKIHDDINPPGFNINPSVMALMSAAEKAECDRFIQWQKSLNADDPNRLQLTHQKDAQFVQTVNVKMSAGEEKVAQDEIHAHRRFGGHH